MAEDTMKLVLIRHGESEWNKLNLFTGWTDVELSETGEKEAAAGGRALKEAGFDFDICYTSRLKRAIHTLNFVLKEMDREWLPVVKSWKLNERHYGAFQGQTRPAMRERYGEKLFSAYRRSFDVRPPEIDAASPYFQGHDARYCPDGLDGADPSQIRAESLADVVVRLRPWWQARVEPLVAAGRTVLIVTHGSVVRAIKKELEGLSAEEISQVNIPTGVPLTYEFECSGRQGERPRVIGAGSYLDPDAARAGIDAVNRLGSAQ